MAYLTDGFSTLLSFASNPTVLFKEKEVTPPGIDGGDPVDTSTMRNTTWRTMAARSLKTLTECTLTASYDPEIFDASEIPAMVNVNQLITITFPDGSTVAFWGYLRRMTPAANSEGTHPTVEAVVQPTNQNSSGTEVAPAYTAPV